jgi:hypothetical protein
MFSQLNPGEDPASVDFTAYVDPSLHMDENIDKLESQFPVYYWRAD